MFIYLYIIIIILFLFANIANDEYRHSYRSYYNEGGRKDL